MRIPHGLRAALASQGGAAPATDSDFENVSLLLHGDGTNGAQNNTFVDGSTNNFTITRNGNTTQGSFSPYGDNWSNYFDGSGDYLQIANNAALNLPTGDFTFECWIYPTVISGNNNPIAVYALDTASTAADLAYICFINSTKKLTFNVYVGSTTYGVTTSADISANAWTHVAAVRSGNTLTLYVNGTSAGTATISGTINSSASHLYRIGGYKEGATWYYLQGYVSNQRLVKGTALYTSAFTPPTTPLTAITNTSLLTCQSNRFKDNSTNNFAITSNGDTKIEAFSPFNPTAAYSASTHGGSGYFDGTGDYVTAPSNSAFDLAGGNFTVEAFVFMSSGTGAKRSIISRHNSGTDAIWDFYIDTDNKAYFAVWSAGVSSTQTIATDSTIPLNQWVHIAGGRNGSNLFVCADGIYKSTALTITPASSPGSSIATAIGMNSNGSSFPYTGYISNARVVKGSAVYTANYTVPTAPLTAITNTSLLLNFTNGGIIDNASKNVLETVGNAQISTSVKKFGTGSLYFDGTGDYLTFSPRLATAFGTGDFTVECWVYANNTNSYFVIDNRNASQTGTWAFLKNFNTLEWFSGSSSLMTTFSSFTNTWVHIAYSRNGTTGRLFIDGTLSNTWTDSTNYSVVSTLAYIGSRFSATELLNGYIDDLRITRGVARYTANFTPPTAAFPDL